MPITAKELAERLGLSATAVSMALNDRPGVSAATRKRVLAEAERFGYDFTRLTNKKSKRGFLYFICYQASSAIFSYAPIFDEILGGALQECQAAGVRLKVSQFYGDRQALNLQIEDLRVSGCLGVILLGTEMGSDALKEFLSLTVPVVVVDSYFEAPDCTCVLINNMQGAYLAADYLIKRRLTQPGYLKSFVPLRNFEERWEGFQKALRANGMLPSRTISHTLPPTIEGATAEMLEVLDRGDPLASCYFAENDLIAIGVMKALKQRGYRVPEDVAIIGFDNIPEGSVTEPGLTTIGIPRTYMGRLAARQVLAALQEPPLHHVKIQVSTELVKRGSV